MVQEAEGKAGNEFFTSSLQAGWEADQAGSFGGAEAIQG